MSLNYKDEPNMQNPFVEVVKKAYKHRWCMKLYCTTCGCMKYRQALDEIKGEFGGELIKALTNIDPVQFTKIPNWNDALTVAVFNLPISLQIEDVLENWLSKINRDIDFTDLVLYKIVRSLPIENNTRKKWIEECNKLALESSHFSLVESLLLLLRRESIKFPELLEFGKRFAKTSKQMQRVLRNACGIEVSLKAPDAK